MTASPCIRVWLGGSFDPIHCGHLQMIVHVYQQLTQTFPNIDIIAKLLPTAGSPFKARPTSNAQRLEMLSLAIQSLPFVSIDAFELQCQPPVYSFNTFSQLKQRYPNDILIFIVGQDSFEQLANWYRGVELINLTNLWVLPRPALSQSVNHPFKHQTTTTTGETHAAICNQVHIDERLIPFIINSPKDLINQASNHIYIDKFIVPDIASRDIRVWIYSSQVEQQQALASLPSPVFRYIVAHQLYAP